MDSDSLLPLIRAVLAQPTAPFHEDAVRAEICLQLAQCPHVEVTLDSFGNVIAHYRRGERRAPRHAFAAHMDHPGFVGGEFLGSTAKEILAGRPPVRDFGAFAMWDLPACEVRDGLIHSRACDDLIGCAAILAMFHELERRAAETAVCGIFTRAEEVGFIGAIQLAKAEGVSRDVTIVSLEASSERSGTAKIGEGVVIRVGDRSSIFDATETAALVQTAERAGIRAQRSLMSGGTCEATAYQLFGYRTAALCVALGNYHNVAPGPSIGAEYVSLADVEALARLCVETALSTESREEVEDALRRRLEENMEKYRRFF